MTVALRRRPGKISALVSDVDGTLVTNDKELTARTRAAVAQIHARGILFAVTSARPPRGLDMLIEPLAITAPMASFNGGLIAWPDGSMIEEHPLPAEVARSAVERLEALGVNVWVFSGRDWLVRELDGPYVAKEQHTVDFAPTIIDDFGAALGHAGKIVGVSADFDRLARHEQDMRAALAGQATVARSQPYYLDITHLNANKGTALLTVAKLLAVPAEEIAVIGDSANDVAMFRQSGFSIAMGNASDDVQAEADAVTAANSDDGFAKAVERFILSAGKAHEP
jgi:Cof subfamily protein (haloacid dehalogenase superfamily)